MPSSLTVPGQTAPVNTTQPQEPAGPIECVTAFMVFQALHGGWKVSHLDMGELTPRRPFTLDDVTAAASNLLSDIDVSYSEVAQDVTTAFVIFQLLNGLWQLAPEIGVPLVPERKPVFSDYMGGLAVSARDAHTQEIAQATAQATVNAQFQLGQAVAQQRQNAAVQAQIEAEKDKNRRRGGGPR